jgi:hypothetical protein
VCFCTCVFDLHKESFVPGLFSDLFLFLNILIRNSPVCFEKKKMINQNKNHV